MIVQILVSFHGFMISLSEILKLLSNSLSYHYSNNKNPKRRWERKKNDEIYLCAEKYFLSNLSTTHHGIKTPLAIFSVHDDGNGIADYFAAKL